ncbi:leucine-rich repeat domain-containing protein [Ralstonia pseudosolanacearum]|uniref:Uncharacterized protein n=1 Tax=Ralstonia solanacearum TaxID=305 RepID=A0A0S4U0X0_RALSL|nr:leucine-rich repeat domain-containing protein [Ralstonia pseudosolanacearum]OAI79773.1 hypothetical protein RSP799_11105 [Ralstonia solanacearum]QCX48458.1 hypothetical protein E7Z57_04710 [Ralstonia pseudosolanacearum]CUV15849.1 protein of unknown function [Ralstonia solanacearum]
MVSRIIGDQGARALAACQSIRSLDLNVNRIGRDGAQALAANTRLTGTEQNPNFLAEEVARPDLRRRD